MEEFHPKWREGLGIGGREDRRQTSQTWLDCTLETKLVSLSDHSNHKIDELPCDFLTGSKCEQSFQQSQQYYTARELGKDLQGWKKTTKEETKETSVLEVKTFKNCDA